MQSFKDIYKLFDEFKSIFDPEQPVSPGNPTLQELVVSGNVSFISKEAP